VSQGQHQVANVIAPMLSFRVKVTQLLTLGSSQELFQHLGLSVSALALRNFLPSAVFAPGHYWNSPAAFLLLLGESGAKYPGSSSILCTINSDHSTCDRDIWKKPLSGPNVVTLEGRI
jgi:hypothetical protein